MTFSKLHLLLLLLLPALTSSSSSSSWPASAYSAAATTLSQLTDSEKVQLVSGQNSGYGKCAEKSCAYVGWVPGLPRLGLSGLYLDDGLRGWQTP
jgi:hypothetical protein